MSTLTYFQVHPTNDCVNLMNFNTFCPFYLTEFHAQLFYCVVLTTTKKILRQQQQQQQTTKIERSNERKEYSKRIQ